MTACKKGTSMPPAISWSYQQVSATPGRSHTDLKRQRKVMINRLNTQWGCFDWEAERYDIMSSVPPENTPYEKKGKKETCTMNTLRLNSKWWRLSGVYMHTTSWMLTFFGIGIIVNVLVFSSPASKALSPLSYCSAALKNEHSFIGHYIKMMSIH